MSAQKYESSASVVERVLAGGGEMGTLIRAFDWSQTPLGSVESWPQSLRSAVSILLPSKAQIILFWGPELTALYNDAYRPVLATKHPRVLGTPAQECWSDIWDVLGPLFRGVIATGEAFWGQDYPFVMQRRGFTEETYFDISYDPVRDETGNVGGIFCIVNETTGRVLGERRLRILRDLGTRASEGKTVEEACAIAAEILANHAADVPFAFIYQLGDGQAHLAGCAGAEPGSPASPLTIDHSGEQSWPLEQVYRTGEPVLVDDLSSRFSQLPAGPWPEPPRAALALPIMSGGACIAFLVAGFSARLLLDESYQDFFRLICTQVEKTVDNARTYEIEHERAEALAEIDRAKTAFFSNISHEFRTPLTLILEPLNELLSSDGMTGEQHETLKLMQRNSLRLLKLVNTLLDFARIEANRADISFQPTDLAAYTADLASVFRSAIEKAGLRLRVECAPLPEPIYVDRAMWEKIVLNLISNALKFTFEGEIAVSVQPVDGHVELEVQDTGVGILPDELPRIFERFHRVHNTRSRTQEGSGIGLALVQDLVGLHKGSIRAESQMERGTTFTVSIPRGTAHLPLEHIEAERVRASNTLGAVPYVQEALRWLPDTPKTDTDELQTFLQQTDAAPVSTFGTAGARILLVDDNADMREYLHRLLSAYYTVETYADGLRAFAAAQERPYDLVLADVMMPGLSGFELLRMLRAAPSTSHIPVILLSARAGEEATIEGLEAGADDYLIKPFSARELMARISAHLEMARLRREIGRRDDAIQGQAVELAVLEERQRISRDLHDAVNQTLFSASMVAELLPHLWEREPTRILPLLLKLGQLTRGAMAEMRTLLMELRPASLEYTDLSELVNQLADVVRGRTLLEVNVTIDGNDALSLPLDVRIAFFRITQEALNNIMKHAQAKKVDVYLWRAEGQAKIIIRDNGHGFNVNSSSAGIGLKSMMERANDVGAQVRVASEPEQGAEVTVSWGVSAP